jgi:omega-6 fatty acid desaturase (delta-12 desaturase)
VEDWWKHYFFRRTKIAGYWDFALVAGTCAAVAFAIALFAKRRGESVAISVGCSMVLPFAAWNASMGFIIFQQHTSADIPWYDDYEAWRKTTSALDGVQRVLFPAFLNTVFHNIMEHHAHHADPSISLHALPRAQAALEAAFPDRAKVVPFTVRGFLETARKCKLYDYEAHRWCDFDGNYTTESLA